MKLPVHTIAVLSGAIFIVGCAHTKAYLIDRGRDAIDIATIAVEENNLGVTMQAGPLITGLNMPITEKWEQLKGYGLRDGDFGQYEHCDIQLLLIGNKYYETASKKREYFQIFMLNVGDIFGEDDPPLETLGTVEVSAALGVGLRLGLHGFELIDFLAGWIGLDLMDDDIHTKGLDTIDATHHLISPDG